MKSEWAAHNRRPDVRMQRGPNCLNGSLIEHLDALASTRFSRTTLHTFGLWANQCPLQHRPSEIRSSLYI
jgi:hypothetical protein